VRNGFNSGKLRDVAFRKEQLKRFRKMVEENKEALSEALVKDLRKNEMEATLMEFGPLLGEIDLTLEKIDTWTAPEVSGCDLRSVFQ
jgi:acyl-CoA reductase-like NAD-dependent aldehyde dehydrogenase